MVRAPKRAGNNIYCVSRGSGLVFSNSALFYLDTNEASFPKNDAGRLFRSLGELHSLPNSCAIYPKRGGTAALSFRHGGGECVETL